MCFVIERNKLNFFFRGDDGVSVVSRGVILGTSTSTKPDLPLCSTVIGGGGGGKHPSSCVEIRMEVGIAFPSSSLSWSSTTSSRISAGLGLLRDLEGGDCILRPLLSLRPLPPLAEDLRGLGLRGAAGAEDLARWDCTVLGFMYSSGWMRRVSEAIAIL